MGKNKGGDKNAGGGGGGAGGKGAKGGKGNDKEEKKGAGKKNGLKIKIRHILCEKQSRMEEAMRKIQEDGESFDKVAREFSVDKAKQGGLLGEMTKDQLVKEFVDVAWGLEPSTVDMPKIGAVKTAHGYHLIMIEK